MLAEAKLERKNGFAKASQPMTDADNRFVSTRSPFYQTVRMLARYYARMNGVLKPSGIDVARWRVLVVLSEQSTLTVSEIAEECVVHISTMTKTIARMAGEGLLSVQTSAKDARSTDVKISEAGREMLERNREKVSYVFQEALRGLSEAEVHQLNSLSARIFENLSV